MVSKSTPLPFQLLTSMKHTTFVSTYCHIICKWLYLVLTYILITITIFKCSQFLILINNPQFSIQYGKSFIIVYFAVNVNVCVRPKFLNFSMVTPRLDLHIFHIIYRNIHGIHLSNYVYDYSCSFVFYWQTQAFNLLDYSIVFSFPAAVSSINTLRSLDVQCFTYVQRSSDTFTTYIRLIDAVLPVKKSIRRPAIKLNFWKPSSGCLVYSSVISKTPKWEDDNLLKTNHSKYDFFFRTLELSFRIE